MSGTLLEWRAQDGEAPPGTAYALLDARNGHPVLSFANGVVRTSGLTAVMPSFYAGGNLIARLIWTAVPVVGNVVWRGAFERLTNGATIDADGYAADQTAAASSVPTPTGVLKVTTLTVTAGAATDAIVAGDLFRFRVQRVGTDGGDTAAGVAQLLAVELQEA